MPKIEPISGKRVVQARTKVSNPTDPQVTNSRWWLADSKRELADTLFGVVKYLKERQGYRQHMAALYARLYGNLPIWNYLGINLTKLNSQFRFPSERPTMNVIQSCTDALVSRMVQSKPKPMFLTQGGNWENRKKAKQLNNFIDGEFYQTRLYEKNEYILRDAAILGDGMLKVYEEDNRVCLERTLNTEIFVDDSDGAYGCPQQMHQLKIVDRDVVAAMFPEKRSAIMLANPFYMDSSSEARNTISSQIMLCESWHLRSGANTSDGRHVIAIENAVLYDDDVWDDDGFPFVKFPYAPRTLGYWAQSLAEQLMGIQTEVNRLLYTAQTGLHLCAMPKWLVEDGSKIVSAHINNQIGGILRYQGTPPVLQVSPVFPPEMYAQLERLIQYAYQQSGISMMAAASQKPSGLNSGKALREYDDLQSDRFAFLSQRYEKFTLDVALKIYKQARKIAKREGKYETVYPGKDSLAKIDFKDIDLNDEEFIIQAFPKSALSNDPAERIQDVIDYMQAGIVSPEEGRRLMDFPDLKQQQRLANAGEERILKTLDEIVEEGKYTPPDSKMLLPQAKTIAVQYYNLYAQENLPEDRLQLLETFSTQIDAMQAAAASAMQPQQPMAPQAGPEPTPTSPMVPNVPTGVAA